MFSQEGGLAASAKVIQRIVANETRSGVPAQRIVLAGFAQVSVDRGWLEVWGSRVGEKRGEKRKKVESGDDRNGKGSVCGREKKGTVCEHALT
eukprot:2115544-Rhodomonas_salina.1